MFFIYYYFILIIYMLLPKKTKKKNKKVSPANWNGGNGKKIKKKRPITSACDRLTRVRQGLIPAI